MHKKNHYLSGVISARLFKHIEREVRAADGMLTNIGYIRKLIEADLIFKQRQKQLLF